MVTKFENLKKQFQSSLNRFEEILQEKESVMARDSSIKRFEITLDLAWKVMKAFLEERKGVVCASPKECVREAYRNNLIEYDEMWNTIVDWRNEAVHTYGEKFAQRLYEDLPEALKRFKSLGGSINNIEK